jgi:hypothetical protein
VAEAQRERAPVVIEGQRQLGKRVGVKVHILALVEGLLVDGLVCW